MRNLRWSDGGMAIAVAAVVLMLIFPMPAWLLDILLGMNIGFSLIILLSVLYAQKATEMSAFPTVLLFATLLRLALNVSSTRLILLTGRPGQIIQQFGEFVVGGDFIVGLVAFAILTIVQLLVITKGAERVSEVAARFALDAMPGKQMSIDADLNAGVITDAEAQVRRQEIQAEADFYGAMDGSSKFVKGEAMVAVLIVAINLLAGTLVGWLRHGQGIGDAFYHYALLAVGDGLVSQVPALLVTVGMGLLVTRTSAEGDLGGRVASQLTGNVRTLFAAAALLLLIGLIPGMPKLPFWVIGSLLGFLAWRLQRSATAMEPSGDAAAELTLPLESEADTGKFAPIDPVGVELGIGLLPLADPAQGGDLMERIRSLRVNAGNTIGLPLPYIRVRDNLLLQPYHYIITIRGQEVASWEVIPDHLLAINEGGVTSLIDGIAVAEPSYGFPSVWIPPDRMAEAKAAGYVTVDIPSVLITHLAEVIRQHAHELLGRQEVRELLDTLKETHPALVEDLTPKQLSLGEVQKVLQLLLRESVPIRDLVLIAEAMADAAPVSRDPAVIVEQVRRRMSRTITRSLGIGPGRTLEAIALAPEVEQMLTNLAQGHRSDDGAKQPIVASPEVIQRWLDRARELASQISTRPVIILTAPGCRSLFRQLSADLLPHAAVLSYAELDPRQDVTFVGVIQ